MATAASATKSFSSLRRVEMINPSFLLAFLRASTHRSHSRFFTSTPSLRSREADEDQMPLLESADLVAVPLPRRPLFPGTHTSAYLENQPALRRALSQEGKGMLVACFMLRDSRGYNGCILRPGLEGEELFKRLHWVGTIAEVHTPVAGKTGHVELFGHCRVRMVGYVDDSPLTVRVKPLEDDSYDEDQLSSYQKEVVEEASQAARALIPDDPDRSNAYFHLMISKPDGLACFGPGIMPVEDKALHQRALEELDGAKRLELSLEILKWEVERDRTGKWAPKPDEHYTDEERKQLAEMKRFLPPSELESEKLDHTTGVALFAPTFEMRVRLEKIRKWLSPEALAKHKGEISMARLAEHRWGY